MAAGDTILTGTPTSAELAELFGVARSTVYRAITRAGAADESRASKL